jgi:hypothetical protein
MPAKLSSGGKKWHRLPACVLGGTFCNFWWSERTRGPALAWRAKWKRSSVASPHQTVPIPYFGFRRLEVCLLYGHAKRPPHRQSRAHRFHGRGQDVRGPARRRAVAFRLPRHRRTHPIAHGPDHHGHFSTDGEPAFRALESDLVVRTRRADQNRHLHRRRFAGESGKISST